MISEQLIPDQNGLHQEEDAISGQRDRQRPGQAGKMGEGGGEHQQDGRPLRRPGEEPPEEDPADRERLRHGHRGSLQPDNQARGDGEEGRQR